MKTILASRVKEEVNDWLSTGKRLIPILFLLLFGVGNVWGAYQGNKAGFWKDGGVVLTWSKNGGSATTTLNYNGESGNSLGNITTGLSLTTTVVHFWREYAYGNICESTIYWELYKSSTKIANGNYSPASWGSWDGNNNTMTYSTSQDFLAKTTGPGDYTIRIYAKLTGQSSDTKYNDPSYLGCGTSWWYNRNVDNGYYSITFTIPSKNLTVAGAGDGNTVSGSVEGVTKGTAYTITATPTAGYAFNGWTKTSGGSSITIANASSATTTVTFNNYSNDATVTANFVAEETHNVTVYYKYGSTTIKTYTTETAVGVTTERTFTAPEIDGYNFFSYTFGTGLTMKSANTTTNPCRFVTKSTGTYSLTTNYNIAPVKMYYGSTSTFANSSYSSMTYDATKKAYYVDVTTNSKPYYFRFDFNTDTKELAGDWSDAGYPNVNEVTANGSKVACATDVKGWENKSSLKFDGINGSSIRIWFSYKDKQAWITEATYTVTITNDGNGTTSPATVTAGKNTLSESFSATANTGYYFKNWTKTSGSVTITNANVSPTTTKATAASTIQANFNPKWQVLGNGEFGGWTAYGSNLFTGYITEGGKDKGYYSITLSANTTYEIQAYDRQASKLYGGTAVQDVYYNTSGFENPYTLATQSTGKNLYIHTAAGGTYQLEWNLTDKKIAIQYPTSWYITTGQKTTGQSDNAGGSFTATDNADNDVKGGKFVANNATVTFVATPNTGYTFGGWYSNAACTTPYTAGGNISFSGEGNTTMVISSIAADKTVYAKFTPKTYTVTLTQTGAASTGTPSVTASYNTTAPAIAALPTAAQGYAFMGYYTAADGEGSQLVAANGTWQNVAGYTSGGKWIRDGGAELFAYFKKGAISALTLDAAIVAQGNTVGITPTLDPVPVGDKVICWRVLHGNGNPLDDQPAFSWDGTKVTFPASTNSGTYLAEAILRKGTTCGGEVLDSVTVSFQVAGDHTVTVQYKCGDDFIQASTSVTGKPLEWTSITAPNIFGYTFSKWKAGDGITIDGADGSGEKASATIKFKATYEGKLTAIYTQKQLIYFKNTLGWSNVYVNFYTGSYWNNPKGSGNESVPNRNKLMTRLGDTDIWYYDYGYNGGGSSITPSLYVSFTSTSQNNYQYFSNTNVVYPANYQDAINTDKSSENGFKAATPMFVPLAGQAKTTLNSNANYYNRGYWVQYTPGTGYTLEIYNSAGNQLLKSVAFTSDGDLMPMEATVDLEAGKTYKYQLRRGGEGAAGVYYGNSSTMAYNNCTGWEMINSPSFSKAGITANAAGEYKFTLNYAANASSQYRLRMTVKYPVSMGDFRIVYSDNDTWSRGVAHTLGTWIMKSHTISARANGIDTVSFFISKGHSPEIRWEKATSQSGTAITWGTTGSWLTTDYTDVSESGVYNFKVTQNATGKAISSIERIGKYTGDYYIRVDCANSKWDNYTVDPDHRMTYSEYSIDHGGYSHYYCHWVQTDDRKNVKFCIANDYSPSISDTLTREVASGEWANIGSFIDAGGNILRNANVRFMWNQSTNKISRAYIDGAQGTGSDNFLKMLSSDSKIKDLSGTIKTEVYFQDNENWIYETNIQAQPNAQYKLVSNWGTSPVITQYFKGTSGSTETLITGSGDIWYVIRVIYDFKTNRILAAWMPEGELGEAKEINADVMFIREHQGDINQLILNEEGEISKINTAYGVMRFNKWTINNKEKTGEHNPLASPASIYERSLYWVSFPFRVKLSEVFGFGTYGTHWILQYYDGAERAEKGMWAETGSYWKFIWDRKDFILEPNTGYLLALETELMGVESSVWGPGSKANQVELFFPSYGTMPDITQDNVVIPLEEHTCTINRSGGNLPGGNDYRTTYDRRIVDSHWNVMGVPTYVNTDDVTFPASEWTTNLPKFLYTWNADDNTITAASASGFTFHAMHAYMVQYYGNVTWSAHSGSPYPIVARSTYSEKPKEVEFCIELTQNETMLDRTFINLSDDEAVSAGFAFNEDMTKEFSGNKPAIYTFIDTDVVAAGNTLPMSDQKTIVPLGVETKQAGDYTIAIPNGTNGVGVTLIDEETGVHTSLSALDYTVSLPAGKHDNRFFLEISPIKTTPTGIEDVQGGNVQSTKVHKVMIDGILYIVKDGKIFDARGARLR